jgi:hypothetical protein
VPRPGTAGPFPNRYRKRGIVFAFPSVSTSVSMNNNFPNRTNHRAPSESVHWWIPLVASTGALLVLVLGTAAVVSNIVNSAISGMG